ncbi:Nramp family divalent metal transporter [Lacrimispora amygdalina]|uniref:Nramp family divalent metal transporter n=1 Tax=Lacrimispora amygdalina TaxID=253257 RepID=UPI000BE22920|nr:Nramp family divalent metal transporter [Lacrimispora amygdalina]
MEETIRTAEGSSDAAFDSSAVKTLSFLELVKRIGPGLVLTGIVIGPGAITTAAMLGARYGYGIIWLFIPILFMGVTFLLTNYRIALLTGKPIIHAIRYYYGGGAAAFVGVASFLSCMFFTMGNISGSGSGMNLIFGINWKIGAIIMIMVTIFCYLTKGVYSKVEKGITICIAGMIIAYYATLVTAGGPSWGELGSGLTHWSFPAGSLAAALGFISTSASVTTGLYGTYLGKEKKWDKEDLFNGAMMVDSITHIAGVILISGAVMLVGVVVLHPAGIVIKNPAELGEMMVPLLGKAAFTVMGIALLASAFSSLLGNTHRTVVLFNAGFDKPTNLEHKSIKIGSMVVLAIAAVICFSYNGSPTQLILFANIMTAVATPVSGFFVCMLIWNKDVNKGVKQPKILGICMIISYLFCLVLTVSALRTVIPKFADSIMKLFT